MRSRNYYSWHGLYWVWLRRGFWPIKSCELLIDWKRPVRMCPPTTLFSPYRANAEQVPTRRTPKTRRLTHRGLLSPLPSKPRLPNIPTSRYSISQSDPVRLSLFFDFLFSSSFLPISELIRQGVWHQLWSSSRSPVGFRGNLTGLETFYFKRNRIDACVVWLKHICHPNSNTVTPECSCIIGFPIAEVRFMFYIL